MNISSQNTKISNLSYFSPLRRIYPFTDNQPLTINRKKIVNAKDSFDIFARSVKDYHLHDDIDRPMDNPYPADSIEATLYAKNWVDAVQWHLEDIIRDPEIDPVEALKLKRRIDRSNQVRTDMVEQLDSYLRDVQYADATPQPDATINTESPAWALDRLSILALKIWHMREEAERPDASAEHKAKCAAKLEVLREQQKDLTEAIDALFKDIAEGRKYMKVYRQMKMYNDPATNPVLYAHKDKK